MGAVDLVIQIESPPSVASALQRVGPGRPPGRRDQPRGAVPQAPRRPRPDRRRRRADAVGRDRVAAGAGQPARRPRPAGRGRDRPRRVGRRRPLLAGEAVRAVHRSCPAARSTPPSTCSAAATPPTSSPSCARGSCGTASPARSRAVPAPSGWPSPAAAPSPTAGCSGCSSSAPRGRVAGSASSTRRWSTSPGSATCSPSAPPAGGSRTSPTTGCWSPPPPACPAGCRSGRATPSAARPSSAPPSASSPASSPRCRRRRRRSAPRPTASTSTPRPTWSATSPSRSRPPTCCPATAPSWWSGSATSSATGAWSSTRPTAPRSTRRWALAINARLRERYGVDGQAIASDDGIVIRIPETDAEPPTGELIVFEPDEIDDLVTSEVGGSALFASRFRECAARALLLPRRDPGRRSPLWQQRQRSAQLLEVAAKYPSFPIVLEAVRECLQDVYDLPSLVDLMRRVERREVEVVDVATQQPSPYARSLLFGYVAQFVYEGDSPIAERRAAALSLDQGLLAELLGRAELRELLDPEVLAEVEAELQRLAPDRRARDAEGVADLLRLLGPLSTAEVDARTVDGLDVGEVLASLAAARRVVEVRMAGEERWTAIEDVGRLRDGLGVPVPPGTPDAFAEPVDDPVGDLVARFARTHGPFTTDQVAEPARPRRRRRPPHPATTGRAGPGARRGVPAGRRRPRVVRRRGPAPPAPSLAREAAPRGRAGRARGAGAVPRRLAAGLAGREGAPWRRRRAHGHRPARRLRPARLRAGVAGAAVARARLRDVVPRRADQLRRGRSGPATARCPGPTAGSRSTSPTRRRSPCRPPSPSNTPSSTRPCSRRCHLGARGSSASSPTPSEPPTTAPSRPPSGSSSGPAGSATTRSPRSGRSPGPAPPPTAAAGRHRAPGPVPGPGPGCPPAPARRRRPDAGPCSRSSTPTPRDVPTPPPRRSSTGTAW